MPTQSFDAHGHLEAIALSKQVEPSPIRKFSAEELAILKKCEGLDDALSAAGERNDEQAEQTICTRAAHFINEIHKAEKSRDGQALGGGTRL